MPEFVRPERPQMTAGNCFGPATRPVAFEAPKAPQTPELNAKVDERRAAMEAQRTERQAAMQARMDEMKKAMEARRAEMKAGNCKQI
jgi:hypothetical protein